MPKLVSSKEAKLPLKIQYLQARDKIVGVWERFDDKVPDNGKPIHRQMMFEYLLDMFGSWEQNGDSLPTTETLYFLARLREKLG